MAEGMALKKIGSIFLLIVAGTIILFVFLGPNQLYAKAVEKTKPWTENVYNKLMHKEKEEQTQDKVYEGIENMFYALVEDLNKGEGAAPCLLTHKPFVEKFMDYKVRFSKDNEGTNAFLMKGESGSLGVEEINKDVCVIDPRNFYDNYLDGTPCTSNCKTNYKEVNEIEIRGKEEIYFNGNEYDLKDLNLMFKADNNLICFFPTHRGNSLCDAKEYTLDDDCIGKITIDYCGKESQIMFYNGAFYGLRKDWITEKTGFFSSRRIPYIYKYKGDDKRVAYVFQKEGLALEYFQKILDGHYDEVPDGKGVYYGNNVLGIKGEYYGLKEHWIKEGLKWEYNGSEKKVADKFSTDGILNWQFKEVFPPPYK